MGFADYFLIVWDLISFARANGVSVGPGRGSTAGSLVAYCLGITEVDPIKYDLLFERMLNPGRKSMPDIDIDFAVAGRDRVIGYAARQVRARPRRADHHVRDDDGARGDPRRRPRARRPVRHGRQDRQARPRRAEGRISTSRSSRGRSCARRTTPTRSSARSSTSPSRSRGSCAKTRSTPRGRHLRPTARRTSSRSSRRAPTRRS